MALKINLGLAQFEILTMIAHLAQRPGPPKYVCIFIDHTYSSGKIQYFQTENSKHRTRLQCEINHKMLDREMITICYIKTTETK